MDYHFPVLRYVAAPDGRWRADLDAGHGLVGQFFTATRNPAVVVGQTLVFRPLRPGFSEIRTPDGALIPVLPDPRLGTLIR
jgi:hypothetical protein